MAMDAGDRPHRGGTSAPSTAGSDLFLCFTSRSFSSSSSSLMKIPSKSLLSPARSRDAPGPSSMLYTSLSRRLRHSGSLKGGGQASPMFPPGGSGKKKGFEAAAEPSSPKVTCIGQVRVKTRKQGKRMRAAAAARSRSRRREGGSFREERRRSQRWAALPISICEAVRALGAEFNCFQPCGSAASWCGASSGSATEREKAEKRTTATRSHCGAVFARWLVAMHEGVEEEEEKKGGGMGGEIEVALVADRRVVAEEKSLERRGEAVVEEEEDDGEFQVCVPPKNALLLMRCRSEPFRMASYANRIWESPAQAETLHGEEKQDDEEDQDVTPAEVTEEDEKMEQEELDVGMKLEEKAEILEVEDEEGDSAEVGGNVARRSSVDSAEVGGNVARRSSVDSAEVGGNVARRSSVDSAEVGGNVARRCSVDSAEVGGNVARSSSVGLEADQSVAIFKDESYEQDGSSVGAEAEQRDEIAEDGDEQEEKAELSAEEGPVADNCTSPGFTEEAVSVEGEIHEEIISKTESPESEERREAEMEEEQSQLREVETEEEGDAQLVQIKLPEEEKPPPKEEEEEEEEQKSRESLSSATNLDKGDARAAEEEVDIGSEEARAPETERKMDDEKEDALPECLLLMLYEPKLSMEVSKETWVCSTDFFHWRPGKERRVKAGCDGGGGGGGGGAVEGRRNSTDSRPAARNSTNRVTATKAGLPPPSMATVVEEKLGKATAYEPLVLTRCKSEPMRSSTKLAPEACFWKSGRKLQQQHHPLRSGAAGIGF